MGITQAIRRWSNLLVISALLTATAFGALGHFVTLLWGKPPSARETGFVVGSCHGMIRLRVELELGNVTFSPRTDPSPPPMRYGASRASLLGARFTARLRPRTLAMNWTTYTWTERRHLSIRALCPAWLPAACLASYALSIKAYRALRRRYRFAYGLCAQCAYDLTGNISGTCPECGTAIPKGTLTT